MKRTELEKWERELKKKQKKDANIQKSVDQRGDPNNAGTYIKGFFEAFRFDDEKIIQLYDIIRF